MPSRPSDEQDPDIAARALRGALPTSRHAEMLVTSVLDLLGERAVVETAGEGATTAVFCRDPEHADWIVPWPILRFARGKRIGWVLAGEGPPSNAPPPAGAGPPPRLSGVTPGELEVFDGDFKFSWTYGDDGRIAETVRGGPVELLTALASVADADTGNPVENLIDAVAAFDPGSRGSGRVERPVPSPASVEGAWRFGLGAIRDAIFTGRVPDDAAWIAVDGYAGSALCPAATRAEAIDRCREEIARVQPVPPPPQPPPELPPEIAAQIGQPGGPFTISAPGADTPAVEPSVANTPIALLELARFPAEDPPFGHWLHVLDEHGRAAYAVLRRDRRGFTVVSARVLAKIDPGELAAMIAEADEENAERKRAMLAHERHPDLPRLDCFVDRYELDERTPGECRLAVTVMSHQQGFHGKMLRAEEIECGILRLRWLPSE